MGVMKNICQCCGRLGNCPHQNTVRIVCHYANLFEGATCFSCTDMKLCQARISEFPHEFKCTGFKADWRTHP